MTYAQAKAATLRAIVGHWNGHVDISGLVAFFPLSLPPFDVEEVSLASFCGHFHKRSRIEAEITVDDMWPSEIREGQTDRARSYECISMSRGLYTIFVRGLRLHTSEMPKKYIIHDNFIACSCSA